MKGLRGSGAFWESKCGIAGSGAEKAKKFSFNRQYETIYGLKDVSFEISEGEYVGLVGLNGAGKTTLIKILSGILTPTDGEVSVMGQKSVLYYDLPVLESFKFYADVYGIGKEDFEKKLDMLDECMQIRSFLHIPVRKLSLGQKMRCEIGVALLHDPKVLFLDEPTLGLDIDTGECNDMEEGIKKYSAQGG